MDTSHDTIRELFFRQIRDLTMKTCYLRRR